MTIELNNYFTLILLVIIAIAVSYYSYRFTIPNISKPKKYFLVFLRSTSLSLIILIFFNPKIIFTDEVILSPKLKIVIDNSSSMLIKNRNLEVESIVDNLKNNFDNKNLIFSSLEKNYVDAESIKININSTNLYNSLKIESNQENYKSILLISDGNYNEGPTPLSLAEISEIPVFTIGIGDTTKTKDIILKNIISNKTSFINNQIPIFVELSVIGFENEKTKIKMFVDDEFYSEQEITLKNSLKIKFDYIPKSEGQKLISFEVVPLKNELTTKNNKTTFIINILKQKKEILILTGSINPDVSAISQAIESDENINVKTFFELPNGELKNINTNLNFDAELLKAEVILLIGYPTKNSTTSTEKIFETIKKREIPLFYASFKNVDLQKLKKFENHLPFFVDVNSTFFTTEQEIFFVEEPNNELVKTISDEFWKNLPPVYVSNLNIKQKPESEILGFAKAQNINLNIPIAMKLNSQNYRSFALLSHGFWKWRLNPDKTKKENFDLFIRNIITWLSIKNIEQLKITPKKEIFSSDEQPVFFAEVLNESAVGVEEAEIEMKITNQKSEILFDELGSGNYETKIQQLPKGNYNFTAAAKKNNKIISQTKGKFIVGESGIEFLETSQNKNLLQQIAFLSGGEYGEAKEHLKIFNKIKEKLETEEEVLLQKTEFSFLNYFVLCILVLIFSFEWIIRKKSGLA